MYCRVDERAKRTQTYTFQETGIGKHAVPILEVLLVGEVGLR